MPAARGGAKKYPGFASNRERSRWIGAQGVSARLLQNKSPPNAGRNPIIISALKSFNDLKTACKAFLEPSSIANKNTIP